MPELMATPWRLTKLLIKHMSKLQTQGDLRQMGSSGLPLRQPDAPRSAGERAASGTGGPEDTPDHPIEPAGKFSRADILMLAQQPGFEGMIQIKRKADQ